MKGTEKFWSEGGAEALLRLAADYLSETDPIATFGKGRPDRVLASAIITACVKPRRVQLTPGRYFGRKMENVLPWPGTLATAVRPPWSCTMCLTMASPRPVPPDARLRDLSTR